MSEHRGQRKHYLYATWASMKARCYNENAWYYPHYGGRGIKVCPEWRDSSVAFFAWIDAELGPRPEGYTLDRIDNDGNYEPGNLRWAPREVQLANRRPQPNKTYPGVKRTVREGRVRYEARIVIDGKRKTIGTFRTAYEAGCAYAAAKELPHPERKKRAVLMRAA